jgi:hypothetical protein
MAEKLPPNIDFSYSQDKDSRGERASRQAIKSNVTHNMGIKIFNTSSDVA